ncbi:MAG: phosphonate ABC transporter ATP-binding protein [Desulfosarcina sp.]|nr:phosphonate ABC transporter ATP-binding protein [Desulfobacterales bacterium]
MRKVLSFKTVDAACVIEVENISKTYPNGTRALRDVSMAVDGSDFIAIIGSSGAGKSTFLRCINRLIRPTSGTLRLLGEDVTNVNGRGLRQVRRRMGMIFQQFHLVRRLSVMENVLVGRLRFNAASPLRYGYSILRKFPKSEREVAFDCLKQVGIGELAFQRADTLSGGQQQRVAIARALAQEPEVFLADEPIASLDPRSAETVMGILQDIQECKKIPVLVNLHHIDFARRYGKRIIGMKDGTTVFEGKAQDLNENVISEIYGPKHEEEAGCDRVRVSV